MSFVRLLLILTAASLIAVAGGSNVHIKVVPVEPTLPSSGAQMFAAYCASCHGTDGKGAGPAAPALKLAPTDLTTLSQHNGGKFPALDIMTSIRLGTAHGGSDMPVWTPILRSVSSSPSVVTARINVLTAYIGSLQAK